MLLTMLIQDIEMLLRKISDKAQKNNLLSDICTQLKLEYGLIPCIGVEIEFYTDQEIDMNNNPFLIKKEKGANQYEIDITPHTDMNLLVQTIEFTKNELTKYYQNIIFHPKPFIEDYGNAMHFHINFLTDKGDNYFDNSKNLQNAASSLCHYLAPTFLVFAPHETHYTRYKDFMAPTHISYGGNNRTVAIRTPDVIPRRLEHRVASPSTDSYIIIFAIIKSIYLGLKHPTQIKSYNKIYGNAFDDQYRLEKFPESIMSAFNIFNRNFFDDISST